MTQKLLRSTQAGTEDLVEYHRSKGHDVRAVKVKP